MIKTESGNLLQAKTEALVNTVNTMGVMGKGIALQFKRAFPQNYVEYSRAAKEGQIQIGTMFVTERAPLYQPRYIVNFPTKAHWKENSKLDYIIEGLQDLVRVVNELQIRSIAIPPLGCGLGGLNWEQVRPLIVNAFEALPNVEVHLYAPVSAPEAQAMPNAKKAVGMTRWRAIMIKLIDQYMIPDYFIGRVEAVKLAYFIQVAGEDMRLKFRAGHYGPFADNVHHAMEDMEGTFTFGLGDGSGRSQIQLLPNAVEQAEAFLADQGDESIVERLDQVAELIAGFETSYTMELLSTVHWVATQQGAGTWEEALDRIGEWNPRKKRMMQPHHVKVAWEQLEELGWLDKSVETGIKSVRSKN